MTEFMLLKKTIDYSRDGVVIFNSKGKLVYANKSFLQLCEYDMDELTGLSIPEFAANLLPFQPYRLPLEIYAVGEDDLFPNFKYMLRTKTGSEVPVQLSVFRDTAMEWEGSSGCVMLLHEIKTLIESKKWEAKTSFLLQAVKAGVVAVNKDQVITVFNDAAEEMTGLKKPDVMGRHHDEVFGYVEPSQRFIINALLYGVELHGKEIYNCPYTRRDGMFVIHTTQLRDQYNEVIGAMVIFQDITEQRKYEEEIARAERLAVVSEVAAGMAHEVRNPLTTVKGFIQLLANRVGEGSQEKNYFNLILEELDRANQIITDFLMLTKPQQKDMVHASINDILNQITMLVESQAFLQGIQIVKHFDETIPKREIGLNQIKQVFLNLVRNALQAMPDGGQLTLSTHWDKKDDNVVIQVTDTGCGIPPEHLSKLFTPFFSTKEAGTGLGLTLSYRIIQNHGGNIEVESQENKGTTFTVKLPLSR